MLNKNLVCLDLVDKQRNRVQSNFNIDILFEIHVDVVHEVLLIIGLDFLFYKTCR